MALFTTWLPQRVQATSGSLDSYVPSKHKVLFDTYNVLVYGDVALAKGAIRGTLAAQGRANLLDFDIGADKICDFDGRSLVVGEELRAR